MKNFTTRQEIEDGRNQARDGDVWMENGHLTWKGRPPGWALQFAQAIRDKQEAVSNWAAEKALRLRAEAEKLEMQQELGWKKLCLKCEAHYSDPHDLGCPVCEASADNQHLREILGKIWDATEEVTGDWRSVETYFAQLRTRLDEARGLVGECFDLLVDIGAEGRCKNLTAGCRQRRAELTDRIAALDWIDRA